MTPEEFIGTIDPEWREEFRTVYALMAERIPAGYETAVTRNSIVFQVPLKDYPDTYNGQPLMNRWIEIAKTSRSR